MSYRIVIIITLFAIALSSCGKKEQPLIQAIQDGSLERVHQLITDGANVNMTNWGRIPALNLAVLKDRADIVRALIDAGANVDIQDFDQWTPLMCAAKFKHVEIAKLLIQAGADIDKIKIQATNNTASIGNSIVIGGNDTNALIIALDSRNEEIALMLLEAGAKKGFDMAFLSAVDRRYPLVVETLLKKGIDINLLNQALHNLTYRRYSQENYSEITRLLLKYGARIDTESFINSIYYGNTEIVKMFLERGADVNAFSNQLVSTPLIAASCRRNTDNNLELAKLFLDLGADVNQTITLGDGTIRSAIFFAAQSGLTDVVKLFLERGANSADILPIAAENGHTAIVKMMLDRGDDPTTGLSLAVEREQTEVVKLLLERGAKPDGCVFPAVKSGFHDIAELLLEHGGDVNETGQNGLTPLLSAVIRNDIGSIKFLLEHKPDLTRKDVNGRTALTLARELRLDFAIEKMLLEAGAEE